MLFLGLLVIFFGNTGVSDTLYSNDFSGSAGTEASQSSPVHSIDSYYSVSSSAVQLDGNGNLQCTNNALTGANYRLRLEPDRFPADQYGAIRLTARVRTPQANWIGFGLHAKNQNGFFGTPDAGPWFIVWPSWIKVFGGYGTCNTGDNFKASGLFSAGEWITVEMTYYCREKAVSLSVNGTLAIDKEPVEHTDPVTLEAGTITAQWVQVGFWLQNAGNNGGALVDRLTVEVLPQLDLPEDETVTMNAHPHFWWDAGSFEFGSDAVDAYQIQIAADTNFSSLVVDDTIQIHRYVPCDPLGEDDYWWRVRALRESGLGEWSFARSFTVDEPLTVYAVTNGASSEDIISVLSTAKNNSPAIVSFETGTHYVSPDAGSFLMDISGASDLIIDGNGSTVIMQTPDAGFCRFVDCDNMTLRNFNIDYDPLPFSCGTVVAVDTTNKTFDFEVWDGFPLPSDDHMVSAQAAGNGWGSLMSRTVPGRLKNNVHDVYYMEDEFTTVSSNVFRFTLASASIGFADDFEVDDVFVKLGRTRGIFAGRMNDGLTIYDIDVKASPGAIGSSSSCDAVSWLKCSSSIADGRWISACADGILTQNYRNGPWVEKCSFEGIMDDGSNQHSMAIYLKERFSVTAFRTMDGYYTNMRVGDTLVFYDPVAGVSLGQGMIVSNILTYTNGRYHADITLDTEIDAVFCGTSKTNTLVYNLDCGGGNFVYRDNTFVESRRFGLLLRAPAGLVINNGFNSLSSPAISIHNNPESGAGLVTSGTLILSNKIYNCGFSRYLLEQEHGSIEIWVKAHDGTSGYEAAWQGQEGIVIRGNTIHNWQRRAIKAHCAEDLLIEGNIISGNNAFAAGQSNYGIDVDNTHNVMVLSNIMTNELRSMDCAVFVTNSSFTIVYGNVLP